ncbi:hypothetical protein Y88_3075 [Novosphingobium nitrogenifigens DSM 19370]|uniref:Uncharacterized protein n=1 Tax=Novosphingobium nitrogenifigens DSM 19370 TaxID=983920 RepID=F1ZCG9_9SPHN|nr:hypothetical protein Y88_3075 [Novosphingobium nitrogenifigens DSM 19370]
MAMSQNVPCASQNEIMLSCGVGIVMAAKARMTAKAIQR